MVGAQVMLVERRCESVQTHTAQQRAISSDRHGVGASECGVWGTIVAESVNTFVIALPHTDSSGHSLGTYNRTAAVANSVTPDLKDTTTKNNNSSGEGGSCDAPEVVSRRKRRRCSYKARSPCPSTGVIENAISTPSTTGSDNALGSNAMYYSVRRFIKSDCVFAVRIPASCVGLDSAVVDKTEGVGHDDSDGPDDEDQQEDSHDLSVAGGGNETHVSSSPPFGIALIHGKSFLPHLKHGFSSIGAES